ncbi:threonine dehydratase [Saccharopolyspora lacisalsi]|uniref:Threonine dehydratase n=1 Tax=Halosaccharopolyspora lacisalsi TaxID=1000566 RepID=A0A839DV58_9PSEU|nr:PLP-dependent lyase/thiolase [Halosaccharopolyspora lacisalsi]MBA8824649.1 threonine dehydratase [Halosaccharopolyspora lacisalsi]
MHDLGLDLTRIEQASSLIDPVFVDTPQFVDEQLCVALGRRVMVKIETLNPLRSFKGRGIDLLAREFAPGTRLVCESTGNFGRAVGYAAARHGLSAEMFVPAGISPVKLARMASLGVRVHEASEGRAEQAARAYAATCEDSVFVEGVAISAPIPESVARMLLLVDDVVVVDDADTLAAMCTALATLGVLPEPAGAADLAAIATHDVPDEVLATAVIGPNVATALFGDVLTVTEVSH